MKRKEIVAFGIAIAAAAWIRAGAAATAPATGAPAGSLPAGAPAAVASPSGAPGSSSAVAPGASPPAAPDTTAAAPASTMEAAKRLMAKARFCALITIGEDGEPHARTLDPFPPEEGLVVWLATKANTRKIAEIRRDPHVTLYYFDPSDPGYVSLTGTAELVDSPAEKAKRWKEGWSSLYKDKNSGSDYLLIRVKPSRLEIVSYSQGIRNDPETWAPASVAFR